MSIDFKVNPHQPRGQNNIVLPLLMNQTSSQLHSFVDSYVQLTSSKTSTVKVTRSTLEGQEIPGVAKRKKNQRAKWAAVSLNHYNHVKTSMQ